ncbi:MAG TPA: RNA-binding protein [Blastocatellia bacterium]|nr:RNA-binding protein [Blastocatellia bacterium]
MKNIFVGNLSFNTNEDELRQIFEGYGQVDRVSILTDRDTGRSRGFGFVEMASDEDGEKAIAALNGSQIGGRTINVNEARPKAERGGGGEASAVAVVAAAIAETAVDAAAVADGANAGSNESHPQPSDAGHLPSWSRFKKCARDHS